MPDIVKPSSTDNPLTFRSFNCGKLVSKDLSVGLIRLDKTEHTKLVEYSHTDKQIKVVKDLGHVNYDEELEQKNLNHRERRRAFGKKQSDWEDRVKVQWAKQES